MDDPFLLDQNRVEGHLELLRPKFERWRQLRDGERPPMGTEERDELDEEYHYLTTELSKSVRDIRWDTEDLQETLELMLKAKSPVVSSVADRESRSAFLVRVRSFLDDVAREVSMATTATGVATTQPEPDDKGIEEDDDEVDFESGKGYRRVATEEPGGAASVPLMSWRKDTDSSSLSFPTVEVDSLRDLHKKRFYNRDWTGCIYRYRYLLCMLAIVCLIVFVTVVALAAKHTASSAAAAAAATAESTPPRPTCANCWCKY